MATLFQRQNDAYRNERFVAFKEELVSGLAVVTTDKVRFSVNYLDKIRR